MLSTMTKAELRVMLQACWRDSGGFEIDFGAFLDMVGGIIDRGYVLAATNNQTDLTFMMLMAAYGLSVFKDDLAKRAAHTTN